MPIGILIGSDYYWSIIEDVRGPQGNPVALKSKVGYIFSGPTNAPTSRQHTSSTLVSHVFKM